MDLGPPTTTAARPLSRPPLVHAELATEHVVQPGETLYRIARAYGVGVEELARTNKITLKRGVQTGERLLIPGLTGPVPVPPPEWDGATVLSEPVSAPGHASGCTGVRCLSWPLRGVIYARFGVRGGESHDGVDLAAPEGTPIAAAAAGKVLYAGEQQGYGTLVILQHEDGTVTLYAHNKENVVKEGQAVEQGQVVARVGVSGRTTGPHVHFEVRRNNKPIDPMPLLPTPLGKPLPLGMVRATASAK
jgi:murein DD-endopeptidase MepM/ murein hydrolase activator NlpD